VAGWVVAHTRPATSTEVDGRPPKSQPPRSLAMARQRRRPRPRTAACRTSLTAQACVCLGLLAWAVAAAGAGDAPQRKKIDFAHDIAPLIKARCAECHTDGKYKGSFSLDTPEAMLKAE